MNKLRNYALLTFLFLAITACATFETNSYKFIATVANTVDASMNGWGEYVRAGKATDTQRAEVKKYYETYQQGMRVARSAVSSYRITGDKDNLNRALDALDASKNELIDLIVRFKGGLQ